MPTEVFTASTTWVVPTGATVRKVRCWGTGGGGGTATVNGGGGGGGGGFSESNATDWTAGQSITITVPAGGAGAGGDVWASRTGAAPTTTAQGALAKGGAVGGNGSATSQGAGGAGGAAASGVGTSKFSGGNGGGGAAVQAQGGGGGGGAGSAGNGGNGASANTPGAAGTPDGGAGGQGAQVANPADPGSPPGGGGGGAGPTAGADGARGQVEIEYQLVVFDTGGPVATAAPSATPRLWARPHQTHAAPTGAAAPQAAHRVDFPRAAGAVGVLLAGGTHRWDRVDRAGPVGVLAAGERVGWDARPPAQGPTSQASPTGTALHTLLAAGAPVAALVAQLDGHTTLRAHGGPISDLQVALAHHVIYIHTNGGPISGLWAGVDASAYRTQFAGVTRDRDGNPLGGVTVWLYRANGPTDRGFIQETTSDANGNYTVSDLSTSGNHFVYTKKSGSPNVFGASDNTLQVELVQVFP